MKLKKKNFKGGGEFPIKKYFQVPKWELKFTNNFYFKNILSSLLQNQIWLMIRTGNETVIIKFAVNIPKIPECNSLVCTTSGKDKLTVGVETQAVHLNVLISSVMWGGGGRLYMYVL